MTFVATPIHHVTTYSANGARQRRALAACAEQGHSVDAAQCAHCERSLGFAVGLQHPDERAVMCSIPAGAERWERIDARPGTVGGWMKREVVCVRPDVSVEDLALLMMDRDIGGLPVVDDGDRPIGIISKSDVVKLFPRAAYRRGPLPMFDSFDAEMACEPEARVARDVMTPTDLTFREDDPIGHAAEALVARRVHRAPVVAHDGRLVGVLTTFDLARALAGAA